MVLWFVSTRQAWRISEMHIILMASDALSSFIILKSVYDSWMVDVEVVWSLDEIVNISFHDGE